MIHPVILSGGSGTRLWPMSRSLYPKQLLALVGERSLLQETALRVAGDRGFSAPLVVANEEHRFIIAEQLREIGVAAEALILEPVGRNTAPAACVAALRLAAAMAPGDPDALMLVLASDHAIADLDAFHGAVDRAAAAGRAGYLVSLGITPDRPETGYGYIATGKPVKGCDGAFAIKQFVEKPDAETAERYVASGEYFWNASIFLFPVKGYLAELERLRPEMLAACKKALDGAKADADFVRLDKAAFAACPGDSIDYAVMEHTARAAVVPVGMGWSDLGSWDALWEMGQKDERGNALAGNVVAEATSNRTQEVKQLVGRLLAERRDEADALPTVHRPWGTYRSLHNGHRVQVKHIMVRPGAKLSLQMHHHRAEHWVVVQGTAKIVRGNEEMILTEDQSTYIPLGTAHRLENPGKIPLHVIEVQSGSYLGEDDIVRFEDHYGRQ
jgi:mannose-1-phosphate guanylyltransferase/mannose-6-phosphate isomerase